MNFYIFVHNHYIVLVGVERIRDLSQEPEASFSSYILSRQDVHPQKRICTAGTIPTNLNTEFLPTACRRIGGFLLSLRCPSGVRRRTRIYS